MEARVKPPRRSIWAIGILALVWSAPVSAQQQQYVRIDVPAANIRVNPTTSSGVVGKAVKGDVFEYEGRQGDWLRINMFSGEYQWVHASLASLIGDPPTYPASANRRRSIFEAMVRAEDRAVRESMARYPNPADFRRQTDLQRLLDDRYKLETANAKKFPVAWWNRLVVEGTEGGWTPPNH